nr:Aquaporin [Hymenolepis microstoma]
MTDSIALKVDTVTAHISGASMNPTRSLAAAIIQNNYDRLWFTLLAHFLDPSSHASSTNWSFVLRLHFDEHNTSFVRVGSIGTTHTKIFTRNCEVISSLFN